MLDTTLAVMHHLGMFTLLGLLAMQLAYARRGLQLEQVVALARVDRLYGAFSGLVIAVGFARVVYAAKGWDYYSHNAYFWAKMAAFAGVGLLSIRPSISFVQWRRANTTPGEAQLAQVRRFLVAEVVLFAFIPLFAALMARGYGMFR